MPNWIVPFIALNEKRIESYRLEAFKNLLTFFLSMKRGLKVKAMV